MADATIKQHDTYPPLRGKAAETALDVTGQAAADTITSPGHGYANGDIVVFSGLAGGAPLVNTAAFYYVVNAAADTFKVSATSGGAAIDLSTDITAGKVSRLAPLSTAVSMKVNCKGPTTVITGSATALNPPSIIGGQVFNWQHVWASGETNVAEIYSVELEVTWATGPPAQVETFPNGTSPTLEIKADLG